MVLRSECPLKSGRPSLRTNSVFVASAGGARLAVVKRYNEVLEGRLMPRSRTPSVVAGFLLRTAAADEATLTARFDAARTIDNAALGEGACRLHDVEGRTAV